MKMLYMALFVCFLAATAVQAQNLQVEDMQFCLMVENKQPVGADSVFSNTMEKIYCFTSITGAETPQHVEYVWYHEDEEMARVGLDVKAPRWRSWTSKKVIPAWHGKWRVDIVDAAGQVLKSADFTLVKDAE